MTLFQVGLATFFLVQFAKTALPWTLRPATKMAAAVLVAVVIGVAWEGAEGVLVGLAAAGLAGLVHRVHRWLGEASDVHRVQVFTAAGARARIQR